MQKTICRVHRFLEESGAGYESNRHRLDYTAQETAQDTHTPGREFAKSVVLVVDGEFVLAVLPAHHRVDLVKLRRALGAKAIRLASEEEMQRLFPDCEVGAEPPFGVLYGLPTYLAMALEGDDWVTFNAGTHDETIRMPFREFERLARPRLLDLSKSV